jgi:hypothetical protein
LVHAQCYDRVVILNKIPSNENIMEDKNMDLNEVASNIKECEIVTDIYSGNYICRCGKSLRFADLEFGGFGNSVGCSCGNRFWLTSDDEGTEELLVYEGFDYFLGADFVISKQRAYARIAWDRLKLDETKVRMEEESLHITFPNKRTQKQRPEDNLIFKYENNSCGSREYSPEAFFSIFSAEDFSKMSEKLEEYCSQNNLVPNYGFLLKRLVSGYNVFNLVDIINNLVNESYIEILIKAKLDYLFTHSFLFSKNLLESCVELDKNETTPDKILKLPKELVGYIAERKLGNPSIALLQSFFKECTLNDFKILIMEEERIFELRDLRDLKILLTQGCKGHRLKDYARDIMPAEKLRKSEFLMLLRDSLKMSRAVGLDFKIYGKNLRQRHDELVVKYKLIKNSGLNASLEKIHENITINQYGCKYIAMVPASVQDFEIEAQNQKHCVLSYVEDMAAEETLIVFIRHRQDPEKSHITLEIQNKRVIQAKRFANGQIDNEDREYLEKLCRLNGWYFNFL